MQEHHRFSFWTGRIHRLPLLYQPLIQACCHQSHNLKAAPVHHTVQNSRSLSIPSVRFKTVFLGINIKNTDSQLCKSFRFNMERMSHPVRKQNRQSASMGDIVSSRYSMFRLWVAQSPLNPIDSIRLMPSYPSIECCPMLIAFQILQ